MNLHELVNLRPYLYHLTDSRNIENILITKSLYSTTTIVNNSEINEKSNFLRQRRPLHQAIRANGFNFWIRDQRPISILALSKCLSDNWEPGDFINHLNNRVFFWCTLKRLLIHFNRYHHENPRILKFKTADILKLNGNKVEFCRINSGATRANSHLGGIAPYRGSKTFLPAESYQLSPCSVVEVTVVGQCNIPDFLWISDKPEGPWQVYSCHDSKKEFCG